jgi:carbon storage regulator
MLVVARKLGEEVIIGEDVCVRVVAIRGDQVRLGISAPRDIPVDRREIHDIRIAQRIGAKPPPVPLTATAGEPN